ncbi:MAG TPA: hypothetical protein DCQ96_05920 [Verrucomicrobiales bacterium]|nr:hypothetical protein [Verrucomicrobiales bacterium]
MTYCPDPAEEKLLPGVPKPVPTRFLAMPDCSLFTAKLPLSAISRKYRWFCVELIPLRGEPSLSRYANR